MQELGQYCLALKPEAAVIDLSTFFNTMAAVE